MKQLVGILWRCVKEWPDASSQVMFFVEEGSVSPLHLGIWHLGTAGLDQREAGSKEVKVMAWNGYLSR